MTVTAEAGLVVIRLTPIEAGDAGVDHGEGELYIPVTDTVESLEQLQTAIREALRQRIVAHKGGGA